MDYKRKAMKLIYEKFDNSVEAREQFFKEIKSKYNKVVLSNMDELLLDNIREVLNNHKINYFISVELVEKLESDILYIFGDPVFDNLKKNIEHFTLDGNGVFSKEIDEFYSLHVHDIAPNIGDLYGILGDDESGEVVYKLICDLLSNYGENIAQKLQSNCVIFEEFSMEGNVIGKKLWEIPLKLKKDNPLCRIYLKQVDGKMFSCVAR